MRRSYRFSIAGLMGAVLVTAILLAALRNSSEETWGGAMLVFTCAVMALAVVGVVCREGSERAWWLGFALFGWGYLALAFWYGHDDHTHRLPTMHWLDTMSIKAGLPPPEPMDGPWTIMSIGLRSVGLLAFQGFGAGKPALFYQYRPYAQIGHSLWALLFAFVGGALARFLFGIPPRRTETSPTEGAVTGRPGWKRFVRPAGVAVAGLALVALLFAARSRSAPGFWAGGTFLVICALLGLATLGAVLDRGKRGDIWLGAALFGAGYLILAFSRDPAPVYPPPFFPTDHFLLELKTWLPRSAEGLFVSSDVIAANERIFNALDQPVPMHFATETSLDDVLKHIARETKPMARFFRSTSIPSGFPRPKSPCNRPCAWTLRACL